MRAQHLNKTVQKQITVESSILYKACALAFTYLILLLIMKLKILSGNQFVIYRIFQLTKTIMPINLGYYNPLLYFDDFLVAFLVLIASCWAFSKNKKEINGVVYFCYFTICSYSILASVVLYKYEVPITFAILYQIESLSTMQTSIDTELMENYRLIAAVFIMLLLAVLLPLCIGLLKFVIIGKNRESFTTRVPKKWLAITIAAILAIFLVKSNYLGMDPLTETPVTTLSKSIVTDLNDMLLNRAEIIPLFDDQLSRQSVNHKFSKIPSSHFKFKKKYNVILIVLETTNYHFFSPQESYLKNFPNLNKLSSDGLFFSNFYTPFPRSSKAFFAILTGHYPLTSYKSIIKIAPQIKVPNLFSILKRNGYSTFAGYSGDFHYDRMADFLENRGVDKLVDIHDSQGEYAKISWCADDELIYDELIKWIRSGEVNAPFFALLLPMNSHHPFWTPKSDHKIMTNNDSITRYINAIRYQDLLIGKLFNFLKKSNKLDNTVIFITGDHGTVFNTINRDDNQKKSYLIDKSSVRVPLFIHAPFKDSLNYESDAIGNHIDILPTILDILSLKTQKQIQGRSLFDPEIKNRISFVYTDYYQHNVNGLANMNGSAGNKSQALTVSSKNSELQDDNCSDKIELCNFIKEKIDKFDKYHNQRLFSFVR